MLLHDDFELSAEGARQELGEDDVANDHRQALPDHDENPTA